MLPRDSQSSCPYRDPKAEILETWAHLKLGGVSGQRFPGGLMVGRWARLGPEGPLVSAFSKSGQD